MTSSALPRVLLLLLLLPLVAACDSSDEDPPEEDGINGVWLRAETEAGDRSAFYLKVTPSTLSVYRYLQTGIDCAEEQGLYGLVGSDGTVSTYEGGFGELRLSLDSGDLVVTEQDGTVTRFERAALDPSDRVDCLDALAPVYGQWATLNAGTVLEAYDLDNTFYYDSYDPERQCYRDFAFLVPSGRAALSVTFTDFEQDRSFTFTRSGDELTGPDGERFREKNFSARGCL